MFCCICTSWSLVIHCLMLAGFVTYKHGERFYTCLCGPLTRLCSYQTGYIMWHSRLRFYIPWGAAEGNIYPKPGMSHYIPCLYYEFNHCFCSNTESNRIKYICVFYIHFSYFKMSLSVPPIFFLQRRQNMCDVIFHVRGVSSRKILY
jgi:hypothetical protein